MQNSTCYAIGVSTQASGQFLLDSKSRAWAIFEGKRWLLTDEQYQAIRGSGPEPKPASRYFFDLVKSAGAAPADFTLPQGNQAVQPVVISLGFEVKELTAPGPAVEATPTTPAPAPTPTTPTAPNQGESATASEVVYIVKSGDTLSIIASRYGLTVTELMSLNGLTNPNWIYVGQRIVVQAASAPAEPEPTPTPTPTPAPTPAPEPTPAEPVVYVVQSGDTLLAIARKFGVTTAQIIEANNISNPNRISVGQRLVIPTGEVATVVTTPEPEPEPEPVVVTYTVRSGDTLWGIARKFGVSSSALAELNGINNANYIRVGQVLEIPS